MVSIDNINPLSTVLSSCVYKPRPHQEKYSLEHPRIELVAAGCKARTPSFVLWAPSLPIFAVVYRARGLDSCYCTRLEFAIQKVIGRLPRISHLNTNFKTRQSSPHNPSLLVALWRCRWVPILSTIGHCSTDLYAWVCRLTDGICKRWTTRMFLLVLSFHLPSLSSFLSIEKEKKYAALNEMKRKTLFNHRF